MHTVATGAVVVEVDGSADGLRVVDFASAEALRTGADLLLAAPYRSCVGTPPQRSLWSRDEADRRLREAVAHVHRQIGHQVPVRTVARDGHRPEVLAQLGWTARLLVVPRQRARGAQRLVAAADDVALAARSRCPVIVVPREWKPSQLDRMVAVGVCVDRNGIVADPVARRRVAAAGGPVAIVRQGVTASVPLSGGSGSEPPMTTAARRRQVLEPTRRSR
jgi:hypothetical protein